MRKSSKNISNYIDNMVSPQIKKSESALSPIILLLSVFSALFIMLLTAQPLISGLSNKNTGGTSANAFGIACSTVMGTYMENRSDWEKAMTNFPLQEKAGRTWTVQEAFGNTTRVLQYHGEGEGGFWASDKPIPETANYKEYASQYQDKLEAQRNFGNCIGGGLLANMANLGLNISEVITGLAQFFATKAFDTELICPDPANSPGNCLNLGKIIGGTGSSQGGIIGALTSSIYLPLLIIAVAFTAGWILYTGLIKRRVREALFGAIWLIASVVIGFSLLLNPSLLAKAPIAFTNAVSTCVIGAFNGENCFNGSSTNSGIEYEAGKSTSGNVCSSNVNNANMQQTMLLRTNAITCNIWKAFVLEPYAQMSFGMNFDDLDSESGPIKANIEEAGLESSDFCVNLYSTKSYSQMQDKTLELTDSNQKICNVLVYQMYLQNNAVSAGDDTPTPGDLPVNGTMDDRWYKVVAVAAANDATWSYWSGGIIMSGTKFTLALLSMITSALGTFIIIVTSIFALVYYIGAVILMAFAPIFFLFGVHPGRGKKLLLGWVEKIVSNLLKFLLSAVFLVATLAIYGAVLQDMSNMGLTLLFVIIVTMALFMYRNELMGMLGRANMGGEQLSSAMSNALGNTAKKAGRKSLDPAKFIGRTGTAALAGSAGAMLATGGANGGSVGDRLGAGFAGAKDGMKRSMRRGGGVIGQATAQYERSSTDNRRDMRSKQQDVQQQALDAGNDLVREQKALDGANAQYQQIENDKTMQESSFADQTERVNEFRAAERETLDDMREQSMLDKQGAISRIESSPSLTKEEKGDRIAAIEAEHKVLIDFANYQGLSNEWNDAKLNLAMAQAIGDQDNIDFYSGEVDRLNEERQAAYANISQEDARRLRQEYKIELDEHVIDHGIKNFNDADFAQYADAYVKTQFADSNLNTAGHSKDLAQAEYDLTNARAEQFKLREKMYKDKLENMRPGDTLKDSDVNKFEEEIKEAFIENNISDDDIADLENRVKELRADDEDFNDIVNPQVKDVTGRFDGLNTEKEVFDRKRDKNPGDRPDSGSGDNGDRQWQDDTPPDDLDGEYEFYDQIPDAQPQPQPQPQAQPQAQGNGNNNRENGDQGGKGKNDRIPNSGNNSGGNGNNHDRRRSFPDDEQRAEDEAEFAEWLNTSNNKGNNNRKNNSQPSGGGTPNSNPFIDDKPPMSQEEREMAPKDQKRDRREAMNQKAETARNNDDQFLWDNLDNVAKAEQDEAMRKSRSSFDGRSNQRREDSAEINRSNPRNGRNNSPGLPNNPFKGDGLNSNRRGRVVPPNTPNSNNPFFENDDE